MISTNNNILVSSAIICIATAITGAMIYKIISNKKRNYVKVAKVLKLFIYPIKSLAAVEVSELEVTKSGVKFGPFKDRTWMLIDGENRFITQRQEPSLALLKTSFHGNQLWIDGPNLATLKLNIINKKQSNDVLIETKVWGDSIQGIYCGLEAEQFFSTYLNKPGVKLIQHSPQLKMRSSGAQIGDKVVHLNKYPIAFQDGSGLLLINQKSIDELNDKLSDEHQISSKNFRPNVLVTDCESLEEDNWLYLNIGGTELNYLKPCDRCVMTTIDPQTGVKMGSEPLNTLRTYRSAETPSLKKIYGTSPFFGVNFGTDREGKIVCGDDVMAVSK